MRIMALDVGEKRIGVAVSDPLGITAQGLEVITVTGTEMLERINCLCREYAISKIIVGLPLSLNGTRGLTCQAVEEYARQISEATGLPVELVDERLTTRAAERMLLSAGTSRKKRKAVKDKLAAVLILETYLARTGHADRDPVDL